MNSHPKSGESRGRTATGIAVASVGMTLFALGAHQGLPWLAVAAGGLLATAVAIGWLAADDTCLLTVLGLRHPEPGGKPMSTAEERRRAEPERSGDSPTDCFQILGQCPRHRWSGHSARDQMRSPEIAVFTLVGVGIGVGGGLWHRSQLGLAPQATTGVAAFVIVACLIGATEELIFRGWLLGKARAFGWPAAGVIAAVAHTAYKTALFVWPAVPVAVDLAGVARWTLAGGVVLGLLRASSGSLLPPLMAHAAFDFVVYRNVVHAPWWVWE
jgi:membrane protease YdiL (CAAX protease family)